MNASSEALTCCVVPGHTAHSHCDKQRLPPLLRRRVLVASPDTGHTVVLVQMTRQLGKGTSLRSVSQTKFTIRVLSC